MKEKQLWLCIQITRICYGTDFEKAVHNFAVGSI
jgi:hypothetical protein